MKYTIQAESKNKLSARLADDNRIPSMNALILESLLLDAACVSSVSSSPFPSISCSEAWSSSACPILSGGSIRGAGGRGVDLCDKFLDVGEVSLSFNPDPVLEEKRRTAGAIQTMILPG